MFLLLLALVDASLTSSPWVDRTELALRSDASQNTTDKKLQQLVDGGRAVCETTRCRLATKAD